MPQKVVLGRLPRVFSVATSGIILASCLLAAADAAAQQTPVLSVKFKAKSFRIQENTVFRTKLVLDPPPTEKFFSYGVLVQINGPDGTMGVANLKPAPAYNFDGPMATRAMVAADTNTVGIRGTLDFFNPVPPPPGAKKLAKLILQPLPPGKYKLKLLPYRILGATEQLFVSGQTELPDAQIQFATAKLRVAAAPATGAIGTVARPSNGMPVRLLRPHSALSHAPINDAVGGLADVAAVQPAFSMVDGHYALEMSTRAGVIYYIQYSSDLVEWKDAQPAVLGTGHRQQWIDGGPPGTESLPSSETARFYRIIIGGAAQ